MANSQKFPVASPIGRIVEGDPWTPQDKDGDGNLRVYKTGPKAGQANPQFYIGLAVPKMVQNPQTGQWISNPDWDSYLAYEMQVARGVWPTLFDANGNCINPEFSWKIRDGDGIIRKGKNAGKSYATKTGFAGHWIISFASSFAPAVVADMGNGQFPEITNRALVKRGYWARIGASFSSNDSTNTPGLYVNLEKIQLVSVDEEIHNGLSAEQVFGGSPASVIPAGLQGIPAGFMATLTQAAPAGGGAVHPQPGPAPAFPQPGQPVAPVAGPAPGFSAPGATGLPNPASGAPVGNGMASQAPGAGAIPVGPGATLQAPVPASHSNPDPAATLGPAPGNFHAPGAGAMVPNGQPQAGPAFSAPAGPAAAGGVPAYSGFMGTPGVPAPAVMLPAANGGTYEQFRAQGWNDEAMIAQGFMAAR